MLHVADVFDGHLTRDRNVHVVTAKAQAAPDRVSILEQGHVAAALHTLHMLECVDALV